MVADLKEGSIDTPPTPALYLAFDQNPNDSFYVVVRTRQAERSLLPLLNATIHKIEPEISVYDEASMAERINRSPTAYLHRSSAWLVGSFAVVAFLLGIVGLYGVIAYSVARRTREIGVRMSLGARPTSVYQLIMKEAAGLAVIGTVLGIAGSLGTAKLMRGFLFGARSWDLSTLAAVATVLLISALLASYIPARRAASLNPVEALRAE